MTRAELRQRIRENLFKIDLLEAHEQIDRIQRANAIECLEQDIYDAALLLMGVQVIDVADLTFSDEPINRAGFELFLKRWTQTGDEAASTPPHPAV